MKALLRCVAASVGMLDGIPIKATNQLGRITTGDRTSAAAVNGAAQNVNYSAAADAGDNAGFYMTQTLAIDGLGANATIADGEVFTIAGVEAYDPEISQNRGFLQNFVVVGGATASAGGAATIRIFPAIIVDDGSSVTGANAVNRAHATVSAAPLITRSLPSKVTRRPSIRRV